jgi:AcrR family transcriptional regulator
MALLALVREKPISAITIGELTGKAGVSRMTFYRNYTSKEEILLSHIKEILEEYRKDDERLTDEGRFYDKKRIRHGFSYFSQYKEFVHTLITCGFSDLFLRELTAFALDKWLDDKSDEAERYTLVSFIGILCNCYLSWIQTDQNLTIDVLTDIIFSICDNAYGTK